MSDRKFSGAISIEDEGPSGMITLRADLTNSSVVEAVSQAGIEMPGQGEARGSDAVGALWMSPDELMLACAHEDAEALAGTLTAALSDTHSLIVNVSDARTVFRLSGEGALIREVLAKLSPADLRPNVLPQGHVRRTRLAQVPAAFWFTDEDVALLICFRSVSDYVFDLLCNAATPESKVGYY